MRLTVFTERLEQCGFVFSRTEKTIGIVKEPEALIPEMILAGLRTHVRSAGMSWFFAKHPPRTIEPGKLVLLAPVKVS